MKYLILIFLLVAVLITSGCTFAEPGVTAPTPRIVYVTVPATPATTLPATGPPLTTGGTCRQGLTWCNGHCSDLSADIGDCGACGNTCPSGQSCVNGQCCKRGQALCSGFCSDLTTDVNNCGTCGNVCPAGSVCSNSKCLNMSIVCPSGQTECSDERCYDLTTDNMNCGTCGNVCPAYSGCTDSVCVAMEDENIPNIVIVYS
jgi:hypothetical protein